MQMNFLPTINVVGTTVPSISDINNINNIMISNKPHKRSSGRNAGTPFDVNNANEVVSLHHSTTYSGTLPLSLTTLRCCCRHRNTRTDRHPKNDLAGHSISLWAALMVAVSAILSTTWHATFALADPALPPSNSVATNATFSSTAVFPFQNLTIGRDTTFTINISSLITQSVQIQCTDCTILEGGIWSIIADGFGAPYILSITFINLLVENGGLMFSGAFPPSTSIAIQQSTFLSNGALVWPQSAQDLMSAQDHSPALLFAATTFMSGSLVVIQNNIFVGRYLSGGLTLLSFSQNTVIDDAYVQISGAIFSASAGDSNSMCVTVSMGDGTSLQLTNSAIFEFQGLSFTHPSSGAIRFGGVTLNAKSTIAMEAITMRTETTLGIEFVGGVAAYDISSIFFRHIQSYGLALGNLVAFHNTLNMGNASTITAAEIRSAADAPVVVFAFTPEIDSGTPLSHIYGRCMYASGSEQTSQPDFTDMTSCDSTCQVQYDCSNAGSTTSALPYLANGQKVGCICNCDSATSGGQRCHPRPYPPTRYSTTFTFARAEGLSLVDARLYTGAAFSSIILGALTGTTGVIVQVEICSFALLTETMSVFTSVNIYDAVLTQFSRIAIVGCDTNYDIEAAAKFILPQATFIVTGLKTYDTAVMISGSFPQGSTFQILNVESDMTGGGLQMPCSSGEPLYGTLYLCNLFLQYGLVRISNVTVTNGTSGASMIVVGDAFSLTYSTQMIVENITVISGAMGYFVRATTNMVLQTNCLMYFAQLELSSTQNHFSFAGAVYLVDKSVVGFDRINSLNATTTPFLFESTLSIASGSWFLLRSIDIAAVTQLLMCIGDIIVQTYGQLTIANINGDGSSVAASFYAAMTLDSTSQFQTKCITAAGYETNLSTNGFSPTATSACGQCTVGSSCFAAYTPSVDYSCNCACDGSGYGALCMPVNPYSGTAVVKDPSFGAAPPTAAPPTPVPSIVLGNGQTIDLTTSMTIENATVVGTLYLMLDEYVTEPYVEVSLSGWHVQPGAQLLLKPSISGEWNGTLLASGGLVSVVISQFYFDSSVVVVVGNMPQGLTLEFRDCIFTTRSELNLIPSFNRFLGPLDYHPFVLFYELTATNGTSIAFFNTIMVNANRTVPTTLLSFAGTTVMFGSSFIFEGFTITGSSDNANSNIMTVSYLSANQSQSSVKRQLNFPTNTSGLRCRPNTLLLLAAGSVFRISDGQVPVMAGSGFIFGCTAVYDHSALVVERIRAVILPTALIRLEQGLFVEDHSWASVRNVVSVGPVLSLETYTNTTGITVDASSSLSLSSLQTSGAQLLSVGQATTINWTVAASGRTRAALSVQCNRANTSAELSQSATQELLISLSGSMSYQPCSLSSVPTLAGLGVAHPGSGCTSANPSSADCNAALFCSATDPSSPARVNVTAVPSVNPGFPSTSTIACGCAASGAFTTSVDRVPLQFYGPQCLPTTRGNQSAPLVRPSEVFTFKAPSAPFFPNFPFATFGPPAFMGLDVDDVVVQGVLLQFEVCSSPRYVYDPLGAVQESQFTLRLNGANLQNQGRIQVVSCSNGSIAAPAPYATAHAYASGASPLVLPLDVEVTDAVVTDGNLIVDGDLPPLSSVIFRDLVFVTAQATVTSGMCGDSMEAVPGFLVLCRVRVQHGSTLVVENVLFDALNVLPVSNPTGSWGIDVFGSAASGGISSAIAVANGIVVTNGSQWVVRGVFPPQRSSDRMLGASVLSVVCTASVALSGAWSAAATAIGVTITDRSLVIVASVWTRMNRTLSVLTRTNNVPAPITINASVVVDGVSTLLFADLDASRQVTQGGSVYNSDSSELAVPSLAN
ncbi:dispersed gene family protein 1 (DGF-1), putative, partial [Bodo saltans]